MSISTEVSADCHLSQSPTCFFGYFVNMDRLPVMEHFYTLQGEGLFAGVPAYFIRLSGCDVGCHWCDVRESWPVQPEQFVPIEDIVQWVETSRARVAVITGGEPAMYDLTALTGKLKTAGIRTHIETSGAYPIRGHFDWVTLSPKKNKLPLDETYKQAQELKVIIYNKDDFRFAEAQASQVLPGTALLLQPEWSRMDRIPEVISFIQSNPIWRLSLQTHKFIHIP